jgi:hypothetical protein
MGACPYGEVGKMAEQAGLRTGIRPTNYHPPHPPLRGPPSPRRRLRMFVPCEKMERITWLRAGMGACPYAEERCETVPYEKIILAVEGQKKDSSQQKLRMTR